MQPQSQVDACDVIEIVAEHLDLYDRFKMSQVCRKWREVLLPSDSLWTVDHESSIIHAAWLDIERLSSFRLFLSKRPLAKLDLLRLRSDDCFLELLDILHEHAPNRIKGLALGFLSAASYTWDDNHQTLINQLCSLQRLDFRCEHLHFKTGALTALTALTSLHITCTSLVLETNCLNASLLSLSLERLVYMGQDGVPSRGLSLEGCFENLNINKLTSLTMHGAYHHSMIEGEDPLWTLYEPIWEVQSLQHLNIRSIPVATALTWPEKVSQLTALTLLSIGRLYNYNAAVASVANLQKLRELHLEIVCIPRLPVTDLPQGLFQLPLLDTLGLDGIANFDLTSPSIWKYEKLIVEINNLRNYNFSVPLLEEPRLKELLLSGKRRDPQDAPPYRDDFINSTLKRLLRFLVPFKSLEYIFFDTSILSGLVTQGTVDKFVKFARARPDVEMEFTTALSNEEDREAYDDWEVQNL